MTKISNLSLHMDPIVTAGKEVTGILRFNWEGEGGIFEARGFLKNESVQPSYPLVMERINELNSTMWGTAEWPVSGIVDPKAVPGEYEIGISVGLQGYAYPTVEDQGKGMVQIVAGSKTGGIPWGWIVIGTVTVLMLRSKK